MEEGGYENQKDACAFHPKLKAIIAEPFPFFMVLGDFVTCGNRTGPLFTFATFPEEQDEEEKCIPLAIPTYTRWRQRRKRENWDKLIELQAKVYPYETKMNSAVWRGSSTGLEVQYPYWRDLPRVKLVQYSLDNPILIDAGISQISQRNKTEEKQIKTFGFMKDRMEIHEFQKYKAIIDIDGNSWSSRFAELLCMNSVVLKVTPGWVDYFYLKEVKPWMHYLPVHRNLTNLVEMVGLATDPARERQMQTIVQNANAWCRSKMTASQLSIDMSWIMASYVEILNKENSRSGLFDKWKESVISSFNITNSKMINTSSTWNDENWVEITTSTQIITSYD